MKSKGDEFLSLLLWGVETLTWPTFRNLTEGYESWAYRKRLLCHLGRLEKTQMLHRDSNGIADRIYRLTEAGRRAALGGREPETLWKRTWDGQWRFVVFDLPQRHNSSRVRLRRVLKDRRFGYLQNSVWVTPDPIDADIGAVAGNGDEAETFLAFEVPCGSVASPKSIVRGAWDFDRIDALYKDCLDVLEKIPKAAPGRKLDIGTLQDWTRRERQAWEAVLEIDPLLPESLLPRGYLGQKAWAKRLKTLHGANLLA